MTIILNKEEEELQLYAYQIEERQILNDFHMSHFSQFYTAYYFEWTSIATMLKIGADELPVFLKHLNTSPQFSTLKSYIDEFKIWIFINSLKDNNETRV
jgi:hypothetical protein